MAVGCGHPWCNNHLGFVCLGNLMIKQHFSPIIWAIIGLHLVWAAGLWFEPSTSGVTGLATIVRMAGGTAAAELVLLVASIMAAIGLLLLHGSARVWSVIPQQI